MVDVVAAPVEASLEPRTGKKKPTKPARPNYTALHAHPLPLSTYPCPPLTSNPLSILHILHIYLSPLIRQAFSSLALSSHATHVYRAYFDTFTNSVHVTDPDTVRALWENGFFGKGNLSRSEPEWVALQKKKLSSAAEVTRKRREERKEAKRVRAQRDMEEREEQLKREQEGLPPIVVDQNAEIEKKGLATIISKLSAQRTPANEMLENDEDVVDTITISNQEHLQLTLCEAFFLHYALGVLNIFSGPSEPGIKSSANAVLDTPQVFDLFRRVSYFPARSPNSIEYLRPDDPFMVSYAVYHHFRSLGWVVRSGVKFAVDYLLYYRGPAFSHAEFAIIVIPSYEDSWWKTNEGRHYLAHGRGQQKRDWYWLHAVNRVQAQVRKTLVLVYVEIPPPHEAGAGEDGKQDLSIGRQLQGYRISEFVLKRWSPNRNR